MDFPDDPFYVKCNQCGKTAETYDGEHLDGALECDCCPLAHEHTGQCRPVTITAIVHLTGTMAEVA